MAKIILDTSTWLELAKPRFNEVLEELESQVEQKITILLTCDIIIEEWDRNKEKIINEVISSIRSHAKSALKMGDFLPPKDKAELDRIIEKYTKIQIAQEGLAHDYVARVEKLLKESVIYKINDKLKIEMVDRALTKKAPFHNNKNNMADALLYFGAVEHVTKNSNLANDLIFITYNHKDFSDPLDFDKLHPDLYRGNVHYNNNLALALKMRKEVIDLLDEYQEEMFWDVIQSVIEEARGK